MARSSWKPLIVMVALLAVLAGCGPEDGRPRGGGMGADLGNHAGKPAVPASKVWSVDDP
jgi:hypothetical protein